MPALLAGCQLLPQGLLPGQTGVSASAKIEGMPLFGKVADAAGRPVADARVLVYPVTNTNPVTNVNPYRVQVSGTAIRVTEPEKTVSAEGKAPFELKTDGAGVFSLSTDAEGEYNLEASLGADQLAWKAGLKLSRGKPADAGTLTLAAPGRIRGKIAVSSALVTDKSGVVVYVPGSPYDAHTDTEGNFDLGPVPAGTFTVKAYSAELGRGEAQAAVSPGGVAEPAITVSAEPPAIGRVTRAGTDLEVGVAPVGGEIDIKGEHFGVAQGARLLVSFSGATGLAATAISETLLRVKVPGDARSGNLRVMVGNLPSNAVPFRVATSYDLRFDALTLVDGGPCYDLGRVAQAKDGDGKAIARADLAAFESWTAGGAGSATAGGRISASAAGTFSVAVGAGSLTDSTTFTALGPTTGTDCRLAFPPGVSTLAGNGTDGPIVDGHGPAAVFNDPSALALDAAGNLLVADTGNHAVRKVDLDGIVSTLAGGVRGYDDGPIASAKLLFPAGLAVAPDGAILIADTYSHRIRKVAGNALSTLAGESVEYGGGFRDGTGAAALFSRPNALAVTVDSTIYVADKDNHAIRRITAAGAVTTMAGTASVGWADGKGADARFAKPSGIAVDASGSIYVADRDNHCIRLIAPDGGVTTLAGTASITRDDKGQLGGGYVDGPAATARFNGPTAVALDAAGALYVADSSNRRIRKIVGGTVSTVAGSGSDGSADGSLLAAEFRSPVGLTVGPDGTIYVADEKDDRIRVIRP